ncbi:MAG: hypothetical protein QM765_31520 [Myxococcales bacterium]
MTDSTAATSATCPRHPDKPAAGVCTRCGGFYCDADVARIDDKPYCPTCAALPEVDYLEAFRLKCWGKRDGWAWVFGLSAITNLALAISQLPRSLPLAVSALAWVVICSAFWLGLAWARQAMLLMASLGLLGSLLGMTGDTFSAAVLSTITLLALISIYFDTRNQLFFRLAVPREKLHKTWDLFANNSVARAGYLLGLFSLIVWPIAAIGLPCSIVGLFRVNPKAHPPVGRRRQAIAGIVLNAIGLAVLAAVSVSGLLSK